MATGSPGVFIPLTASSTRNRESNVFSGPAAKVAALTDDVTNSVARTDMESAPAAFARFAGPKR